jgi:hypothetical protein
LESKCTGNLCHRASWSSGEVRKEGRGGRREWKKLWKKERVKGIKKGRKNSESGPIGEREGTKQWEQEYIIAEARQSIGKKGKELVQVGVEHEKWRKNSGDGNRAMQEENGNNRGGGQQGGKKWGRGKYIGKKEGK